MYDVPVSRGSTEDVLERYVRQYIESQETPEVVFAWQGGEPTLMGVDFFRRVVELQRQYANGKKVSNTFQTNGTLIDGVPVDGARPLEPGDLVHVGADQRREKVPAPVEHRHAVVEPQLLGPQRLPQVEVLLGRSAGPARQGAEGGGDQVGPVGQHGELLSPRTG